MTDYFFLGFFVSFLGQAKNENLRLKKLITSANVRSPRRYASANGIFSYSTDMMRLTTECHLEHSECIRTVRNLKS